LFDVEYVAKQIAKRAKKGLKKEMNEGVRCITV